MRSLLTNAGSRWTVAAACLLIAALAAIGDSRAG
jgi:hypothetical protein